MRWKAHAGFGGRRRGNQRPQDRNGASPPTQLEADFQPCSYGFRPGRRTQDAIAEVHYLTTRSYEWIVEADIKACFDELDHSAILDRVRRRIVDKRVLALIKAFLKAGIMTEHGDLEAQLTGTPQGGILSPLMANIALTALDEHYARAWEQMGDQRQRAKRRRHGQPNYRLTRYADDFVICLAGNRRDAEALIAQTERVIRPLGLTLSAEKTQVAHIDEGLDFLGWRIQRHQGSNGRRYVYTYPSKRALASVKTKVKAITQTDHQQTLGQLIHRLNPVLRGWCAYFRPGVSSRTFNYLRAYTWQRVCDGCDTNIPRRTGAGCDAATSQGGGRQTARRSCSIPAALAQPATATEATASRHRGNPDTCPKQNPASPSTGCNDA